MFRSGDAELGVSRARTRDGYEDCPVRLGIRDADSERPARIEGRIYHRQYDIHYGRYLLPVLAHFERTLHRGDEPEYVGGHSHAHLSVPCLRGLEKIVQRVGLAAARSLGKDLRWQRLVRLREAYVIELYLAETHLHRFIGDAEIVIPYCARVRIHPCDSLLVAPRSAVGLPNHMLRIVASSNRILEDHHPRDRKNPVRAERIYQRRQIRDLVHTPFVALQQRVG